MTATDVPVEVSGVKRDLLATDRCDRCGAQAFVLVVIEGTDLLFCAHHYREHAPKLDQHKVLDRRSTLEKEASDSPV